MLSVTVFQPPFLPGDILAGVRHIATASVDTGDVMALKFII